MDSMLGELRDRVREAKLSRGEPESWDTEALLKQAVRESIAADSFRGAGGPAESPGERMKRLRAAVEGDVVGFHDAPPVVPYTDPEPPAIAGGRLWRIGIPLTLFPQRDGGFTGVECIVEFSRGERNEGLRVLAVRPEGRTRVMGRLEIGASANVTGQSAASGPGAGASASAHGKVEAGPFVYEAARTCVATEIVRGTGAIWRLDDPMEKRRVGRESHELAVVVEVGPGDEPIHAAGYLKAYTSSDLLTVSLGGPFWKAFKGALKSFFQGGVPVEAYQEWVVPIPS